MSLAAQSLMALSESFVQMYGLHNESELCLDKSSQMLGIEKRRIYDIVNVFESVGVVARTGKNKYTWYGSSRLEATLKALREEAADDGVVKSPPTADPDPIVTPEEQVADADPPIDIKPAVVKIEPKTDRVKMENRRDKSLGILSQRFVQLLMVYGESHVSVDEASNTLLADQVPGMDSTILKTKARRLYDIANILAALDLVQKCQTPDRRPAFRWVGPNAGSFKTQAKPLYTRFSAADGTDVPVKPRRATHRKKKSQPVTVKAPPTAIVKPVNNTRAETRLRKRTWKTYCEQWCEALQYLAPNKELSESTVEQFPMAWLDAFDIEGYMELARKAGAEHLHAAEAWKEQIAAWKNVPENYYPSWQPIS